MAAGLVIGAVSLLLFGEQADKKRASMVFDLAGYQEIFTECYRNAGKDVESALQLVADEYEGNEYMSGLINKAIDYINDEYGDYYGALKILNPEDDEKIQAMHEAAINGSLE